MTIREATGHATEQLSRSGVEPARFEAEIIVMHVLGIPWARLLVQLDSPLDAEPLARVDALVARRAGREPLAYILGSQPFMSRDLKVDPRVLVPRPETELLAAAFLDRVRGIPRPLIADVGCGCGALAVTFACELPQSVVYATDVSQNALDVAAQNAVAHRVADRIIFLRGSLLAPLIGARLRRSLHAMAANLPYVRSDELPSLEPEVSAAEPRLALDGGPDGLSLILPFVETAWEALRPGGLLAVEVGLGQSQRIVAQMAHTGQYEAPEVITDYAGIERVVITRCRHEPASPH